MQSTEGLHTLVLLAVGSNRPQPHGFHPNLLPAQGGPGERRAERQQLCGGVAVRAAWSMLAIGRAVPTADVQLRVTTIPIWGLGPDADSSSSASRRAAGDEGWQRSAGRRAPCSLTSPSQKQGRQPGFGRPPRSPQKVPVPLPGRHTTLAAIKAPWDGQSTRLLLCPDPEGTRHKAAAARGARCPHGRRAGPGGGRVVQAADPRGAGTGLRGRRWRAARVWPSGSCCV